MKQKYTIVEEAMLILNKKHGNAGALLVITLFFGTKTFLSFVIIFWSNRLINSKTTCVNFRKK